MKTKKIAKSNKSKKAPNSKANKFAKVGWITGIISSATCWTGIIGLILGIVSIVFSSIAKRRKDIDQRWLKRSKTGLILGIIGTVLSGICTIIYSIAIPYIFWKYIIW